MFNVGDLVVCVDDSMCGPREVRKGNIYHVAMVEAKYLRLREMGLDRAWWHRRFRPVHSIQIFHDIANGVKQPEKEFV